MIKIITQILDLIKNFLNFKIKKEEQKIKDQEKEEKSSKTLDERKQEASNAVFNGDIDAINKIINSIIVVSFSFILIGCASEKVIYVPADRQIKKLTYEDVEGYFVPNIIMSELLQYKVECGYYKEKYEQLKYKEDNF